MIRLNPLLWLQKLYESIRSKGNSLKNMQVDNACEVVKTMPEGEAEVPAEGNGDVVRVMHVDS